jgi:hypothetical protein
MAISFGSSANNFTTFLDTVNNAQFSHGPKDTFDVDTAAKQALVKLSSLSPHDNAMNDKDLRDQLGLSDEQLFQVIGHLEKEEMILPRSQTGHNVTLSDFAAAALKVFDVS